MYRKKKPKNKEKKDSDFMAEDDWPENKRKLWTFQDGAMFRFFYRTTVPLRFCLSMITETELP